MTTWNYMVVAASALLLVFLFWMEITRPDKARLTWRLVASLVAVTSLACITLPVSYRSTNKSEAATKHIVFLTRGFSKDSLDDFLDKTRDSITVYATDPDILKSALAYNPQLPSGQHFFPSGTGDALLHVFGNGLSSEELDMLEHRPMVFHAPLPRNGITSVSWTKKIVAGKPLIIQGRARNTTSRAGRMVLSGFQTSLDSIIIPPSGERQFELRTIPKHQGRAVYSVSFLSGTDTIEKQSVPFQVDVPVPVKVLILAAFPDFENKFLKNWLFKNGYKVAVRTAISKNKFSKEYLNVSPVSLDHITPSLLAGFDVVISDGVALAALSKTELSAIRLQVERQGLGLVIRADSTLGQGSFYGRPFPVVSLPGNNPKPIILLLDSAKLPPLPAPYQAFVRLRPGTQSVLEDERSRVLVSSTLQGSGKVVLTTVPNTFSWVLSGNEGVYSSLWSRIIENAARKTMSPENWSVIPALPGIDEAAVLQLGTVNPGLPRGMVGQADIFLRQSAFLPYYWQGVFWPATTGWQPVAQPGGSNYWWYVFDRSSWQTLHADERVKETKRYTAEQPVGSAVVKEKDLISRKPVPKIYFFMAFLLSCGFLWAEKKYAGMTNIF